MSVTIKIPTPLRRLTNGQEAIALETAKVADCLDQLEMNFPGIRERLMDETGEIRHFVNVYVNGEDVRFLDGLDTNLKSGDEISIVPAVAGGAFSS